MLSWSIFRNYLLSRRAGALVRIVAWNCVIGIGLGVAALVVVLSVMNGFNLTIRGRMLSIDPHLVILESKLPDSARAAEIEGLARSSSRSGVESQARFETQDVIVRAPDGVFGGAIAKGYDHDALQSLLARVWKVNRRDTPPPLESAGRLASGEVVMGADLARGMGLFEGDEVLLIPPETLLLPKGEVPKFRKYKIKSLISTQSPDFDAKMLFYDLDAAGAAGLKALSREAGVEIRLNDAYEAASLKERLVASGLKVQTWGERDTALFFALRVESALMTLFLSLAVLITSFSIVTVMLLLLNQKRQDIGMLMALGLSVKRARGVFLRVGLFLSYLGILGGMVLGIGVCLILDFYPLELLPDIYTDSTLPAKLTLRIVLFVLGCSSLVAVLGAWLPVWRYVITNPSEALRKPGGAAV